LAQVRSSAYLFAMSDASKRMASPASAGEAFEIVEGPALAPFLLVCDHASNEIPAEYANLGLPAAELERHIAYDLGAASLTRALARRLDAPAVLSRFSRLVIDPNRGEDDPTLVMQLSDGAAIPGNTGADAAELERRLARFWRPYDAAIAAAIDRAIAAGNVPTLLSIHTFTPTWRGIPRPWHCAVLWDRDPRLAQPLLAALRAEGDLVVGDNASCPGRWRRIGIGRTKQPRRATCRRTTIDAPRRRRYIEQAAARGVQVADRTQVGIVGAGPAGLFLSHLLAREGIDCVILEARDRAYVEGRVRAGVLEQGTVDLMHELGAGERLKRECMVDRALEIRFSGNLIHLDLPALTGGKEVTIYGQQEVVKDLIAARLKAGGRIEFEAEVTALEGIDSDRPTIRYKKNGKDAALVCDIIAGCDGFHGICRGTIPEGALTLHDRVYPFGWLGILSESPPLKEMTYANHERGFALCSRRSPKISRHYVQCTPDEDITLWPDARIWDELHTRMDDQVRRELKEGRIFQKGVTPARSFVAAPMRHGRLFLAGDAAHIVPPTGAKGLNLAVADVRVLARALAELFLKNSSERIERYSDTCLRRVWKVVRFSNYMTLLLHRFPAHTPFDRQMQLAELDYVFTSRAAATAIAENYVGLPYEDD
jgi:p-hydroxybenzoate 3-monooxygenase